MLNKDEYILNTLKHFLVKEDRADHYKSYSASEILVLIAAIEVEATLGADAVAEEEEAK